MVAEDSIDALTTRLTDAGLRGEPEVSLVNKFCERAVAAGLPISRALAFNQPQMLIRPDVRFDANSGHQVFS